MLIEPYADEVACAGSGVSKVEQIDDLIRLLVTIRHRWGNTAVSFRLRWGSSALWATHDGERLEQLTQELRKDEADSVELLCDNPDGPPNNAVVCRGLWCEKGGAPDWESGIRFEGETLLKALEAAVSARHKLEGDA